MKRSPGAEIGLRVERLRTENGFTQGQVATYAKVDRTWVSKLERGEIDDPGADKLMRVAQVFGVSLEYLITGRGPAPVNDTDEGWFKALPLVAKRFVRQTGEAALQAAEVLGGKVEDAVDQLAGEHEHHRPSRKADDPPPSPARRAR